MIDRPCVILNVAMRADGETGTVAREGLAGGGIVVYYAVRGLNVWGSNSAAW
jgi:hypothetical protein